MRHIGRATGLALTSLLLSSVAVWAGPKIVSGPGANAQCFKPWSAQTKFFQWERKPGPYRIALVNGFVGNTWRIQMVKTAKAFAEQPGIKENIKEFKVVSTGTDVAAQLGAMEDFINQGVQAFVSNFEPWGGSAGLYLSTQIFEPLGGAMRALWVIYFLLVAVMGLSLYLSYAIKTSKFGLGLIAIGQNEDAAVVLGVPAPLYKALAYSLSAFLPALAGGLYFFKSAFIQPSDAFDLSLSTEAMVIVMLGGRGTVTGAAVGAYLYEELRGWLLTSETFSNFQLVVSGVLLLIIVLFVPGGLMGWIYGRWPRMKQVLE